MMLPAGAYGSDVQVTLKPESIAVTIGGETVLQGALFAAIKAEESVWLVSASLGCGCHQWALTCRHLSQAMAC